MDWAPGDLCGGVGPLILVCVGLLAVLVVHYYGTIAATRPSRSAATAAVGAPAATAPSAITTTTATARPTATLTATAVPRATAEAEATYVVKAGDTLSEIAALHAVRVDDLAEHNEIASPDSIAVGQVLAIPSSVAEKPTASNEPG